MPIFLRNIYRKNRWIALHKEDKNVLELIKATLGCGGISIDRNTLVFSISKLDEIKRVIIPLFEQFPLNTKKHLDYLAAHLYIYIKKIKKTVATLPKKLGETMNNDRLSTNPNRSVLDAEERSELDKLIKSEPPDKCRLWGSSYDKKGEKYIRSTYIIRATFVF